MIRSRGIEEKMRRQRADAKTLDNLFRRRIEVGAKCAPFVSQAILQTAKEVFPLDPQQIESQLGLGQIKLLVVAAHEPAGKALDDCQKVTVRLTLDASQDDFQVRVDRGVIGLRRARLLRLASEARLRESERHLREDVARLEGVRTQLAGDVETIARHLETERDRLRDALGDMLKWVDEHVQPAASLLVQPPTPPPGAASTPSDRPTLNWACV